MCACTVDTNHYPVQLLCACADPYVNDATFALSMVFLEELGATGNKVCCLLNVPSTPSVC